MGDPGGSLVSCRRAGDSPRRCIYERIGDIFVIGAVGAEQAGLDGPVGEAKVRLSEIEP
jgi:hypothetical protein